MELDPNGLPALLSMQQSTVSRILANNWMRPNRLLLSLVSMFLSEGLRIQTELETGEPITVLMPDYTSAGIYLDFFQEGDILAIFEEEIQEGMTVFDIGAHIGYHTLNARRFSGESGSVVAFEANPRMIPLLEQNVQPYATISVENRAVTSSNGTLRLKDYGARWSGQTTRYEPRVRPEKVGVLPRPRIIEVPAITIDEYVESGGRPPDFMKLDIEGGELDALLGAVGILETRRPTIVFEGGDLGKDASNNTYACLTLLSQHGYSFFEHHPKEGIVKHIPKEHYPTDVNILCKAT